MPTPSGDVRFAGAREIDFETREVDERALDRFLERMTDAGCLTLLQWARRQAPHLLRILMVAFLRGQASVSDLRAAAHQASERCNWASGPEAGSRETATLKAAEREYIARVVSQSRTLNEAASKLGIHSTTLWRKRKLYGLGQ